MLINAKNFDPMLPDFELFPFSGSGVNFLVRKTILITFGLFLELIISTELI